MTSPVTYPARPQYFAHRFIRLMTKTAISMEVGAEGFALLTVIAMQEDACRYSKPISFWNSQLTVALGFRSEHEARMRRVRNRCVEAGWLNYEPGGRTQPGHYFVTIPTNLIQIEDGPSDESGFESDNETTLKRQQSDNETTLKRQQSDNETTLKRQQSDSFLTSTLPSTDAVAVASARAAAADDLGIIGPDPGQHPTIQIVREKNSADLQAMHGLILIANREERSAWDAVLREYTWGPVDDACRTIGRETPPGRRILLSRVTAWLAQTYRKTS